jgi:hypothetical protein
MLGADVPTSLTAWQSRELAQETAVKTPTPEGTVSAAQLPPALTVVMMTGLPNMPNPTAVQSAEVAHEIALRPLTSAGIGSGVQEYPSFTEPRRELTPTAKQTVVVGQEAEFSCAVPDGGACEIHDNPPVVVSMIVEPAPEFPVFPTATQSSAEEQEIPASSTAFAGGLWDDQVEPLFEVPTV